MRLSAPDAGRRRAFLCRSAATALALGMAGCSAAAPAKPRRELWLDPVFGLSGARLTDKTDPTGFPLPGGKESFVYFQFPVAVVASLESIFIADAGTGRLFRYVQSSGLMTAIPGVRVRPGMRLQAALDGTVFALDAMGGEISRYSMQGIPLPAMQPRMPGSRYLDFAIDLQSGTVLAVDAVYRVVDRIEPMGRIAIVHMNLGTTGPLALDGSLLVVADAQCKCVSEWRGGRMLRRLAVGLIRLPKALAAEKGEIYVLDGFDRSISRVSEGGLETIIAADLNLVSPEQMTVAGGMMYVADGAGRKVMAFKIRRRQD